MKTKQLVQVIAFVLVAVTLFTTSCMGGGHTQDTTGENLTENITVTESNAETQSESDETQAQVTETTASEEEVNPPKQEIPSVGNSLEQLTFTPASPEGQVLTEDGHSPQIVIRNYNETATDALGRTLLTSEEVGLPKENRYVGIFYSIWTATGASVKGHIDVTKAYACNPEAPYVGTPGTFCWWSEPETGYHKADDEWQIRRDMYYLSMAGVDFIFMDFTNGTYYAQGFTTLLDTMLKMREEGQMTPYVACWTRANPQRDGGDLGGIYQNFYKNEKYKDLWFYWEGKPLVMLKPNSSNEFPALEDQELRDFFTCRISWMNFTYPDVPSWSGGVDSSFLPREPECVSISVAGHAFPGQGRSGRFSNEQFLDQFLETTTMGEGIELKRQFELTMRKYPNTQILRVSTWNEWTAQYLPSDERPFNFVDQFNAEFSRDIEPMKGGFTDNYFYQFCNIVRQFKGVLPADENTGAVSMDVNGEFDVWQKIYPVFTDYEGDISVRNATDPSGTIKYTNYTGRNDIVESRITADKGMVYVYARTNAPMTSAKKGQHWMLLFIDADNDKSTGFEGYDYVINYAIIDDKTTTICAYRDGVWREIGLANYKVKGNELMVAIPRSLLGLTGDQVAVNFHWMDNVTDIYSLESWFTTGDSAPERRNNYTIALNIAYDASAETLLDARTEGTIGYMPAVELKAGQIKALKENLEATLYDLPQNYGKMPNLDHMADNALFSLSTSHISAGAIGYLTKDFALSFEGYVKISADGTYTFRIAADDGARLYIDGRLIAEVAYDVQRAADGVEIAMGSVRLAEGYHTITIEYAETGNGNAVFALDGEWELYH